ncbi:MULTISPECIES: LysR family transcriptional regulator [unclassified Synechococcus]|uniref:LysR family transcriptional regulator n=1 Tax=unclassified Synechococcus TaxID=2626047 RepID=UPI0008FF77A8|nr:MULTISPECIES: LysR family transcriptional regulator [unclassified Synechococcus]APD47652.1 LysR family transcriptional regulator [Synechococcus sp. SynAce01]MCT0201385.1 LysR family transcriptional regulator [Synechococcus sp. CS-603]MCT0246293.1 LysR family transcriptional regulator [Synechococcus sp. CS-601]TWB90411.1 DNA-binding transcriptional LysR family regulator [Synechococcus sp. Ace-Pa]
MADLPFTLDQLRILRAIASEGSFKKAADSLYVTQPAVSLQIQNLEKQLDVSLFDRGGRKAQLTEAGHLLLSYCDRILGQCQEACRSIEDLHNLKGGSLVVGASQTTGTYLMPRMIGLFRQKYPDVAVQLQVHSTRRTSWSVANGQVDLAIIGGELPSELNDLLQVVPYANDELALVLPVKHPLSRLSELHKDDLYRLGFVCLDAQSTTRKMVDHLLSRSGLELQRLKIEMELNSFEAIKNAVQSGLGAAFLPVVSIERELATGSLQRLPVADLLVRRQLKLITHPARYCSRASEAFRREVLPEFASPDSPLRQPAKPAASPEVLAAATAQSAAAQN